MPKEVHELTQFLSGTITTPSEHDIPKEAASYSENIDPHTENGKLRGIPEDAQHISSLNAESLGIINDSGTHHLVHNYTSNGTKYLNSINDLYGNKTPGTATTIASSIDELPMISNNKEVHIGTGNTSSDYPQWAGIVTEPQFGTTYSGVQVENAELSPPGGTAPEIYNYISDGTYFYGFGLRDTYLYKFKVSDGSIVSRKLIGELNAIADADAFSSGNMWVLSRGSTGVYSLLRISKSDLTITASNLINTFTLPSGFYISDMIETTNKLWFAAYKDGTLDEPDASMVLMNTAKPSGSGALTMTDKTPDLDYGSAGQYKWVRSQFNVGNNQWEETATQQKITATYKRSLVVISSTNVGWVCKLKTPSSRLFEGGDTDYDYIYKYQSSTGDPEYNAGTPQGYIDFDNALFVIPEDYNASNGSYYVYSLDQLTGAPIDGVWNDSDGTFLAVRGTTPNVRRWATITYSANTYGASLFGSATHSGLYNNLTGGFAIVKDTISSVAYMFGSNSVSGGFKISRLTWNNGFSSELGIGQMDVSLTITDNGGDGLDSTKKYYYKLSYLYDGYQESPLCIPNFISNTGSSETKKVQVDITAAAIPKRVTHLQLYRAESASGGTTETSFYRLVASLPLDTTWTGSTTKQKLIFDNGSVGTSYEAMTGIAENIRNTMVHYGLAAKVNGHLLVGKTFHPDLEDGSNYIFKSQPLNFDQFNVTKDFLILPSTPTALASFNGRLYAFDENNTYRINSDGMYIEDTFNGVGCESPSSFCVTEFGMCMADYNNIYLHSGNNPKPIGNPILRGDTLSWQNRDTSYKSKVSFDGGRNAYVITFKTGSNYYAWMYSLGMSRWDLITLGSNEPKALMSGREGDIFMSQDGKLKQLFTGTDKRTWKYTTKEITLGTDTIDKMYYKLKTVGDNTGITIAHAFNSGSLNTPSAPSSNEYSLSSTKARSLKFSVIGTNGSNTDYKIDALGVIYRRLPVK